jgi:hypothetical protein
MISPILTGECLMDKSSTINPNSLARQSRERTIRQVEESYKNALDAADKARESAIRDATATKTAAVKQFHTALEQPQKRLSEAHDHIEARLRKQELEEARRQQEQILIKAEDTGAKAFKQAEESGKRLAAEAGETHRHAIQKAYENEKKMKLEANQAIKTQKETARTRLGEDRKARQRTEQEATEAKTGAQKAAGAERSAREALVKTKKKVNKQKSEATNIAKVTEAPEPESKPLMIKDLPKAPAEPTISSKPGPAGSRTGMIKLIIAHKDAAYDHMLDFENSLRQIPDIRLVMISGTTSDGAQIIVSSERSVALSDILRQLPMVEEVMDRPADILIKLKPVVIFESNI